MLSKRIMVEIIKKTATNGVIYPTRGIKHCEIKTGFKGFNSSIETIGLNFQTAWLYGHIIETNQIYTNHVHAVMNVYGIEAALGALIYEVKLVFAGYGIEIDLRQLSLVADFLMARGEYRACSRLGISLSESPLLKMSFETAVQFITDACIRGYSDNIATPSACITLGQLITMGTGTPQIVYDSSLFPH
jgi:DNA-directed RNA polymerase I subunit RPA1